MKKFVGFSTKNKKAINHVLTGKDLVIEDLMNHIMTRKGERIMLPTYGSIIHEMIFEPLTPGTKDLIEEDLRNIISQEPRVSLVSIALTDNDHQVNVVIKVSVLPTNEVVDLTIDLERE